MNGAGKPCLRSTVKPHGDMSKIAQVFTGHIAYSRNRVFPISDSQYGAGIKFTTVIHVCAVNKAGDAANLLI